MGLEIIQKKIRNWLTGFFVASEMDEVLKIISERGVAEAINFLKKKHIFFRPGYVRFLIKLYEYLALNMRSLPLFEDEGVFLIHFCCWGEFYAEKVEKYFL